MSTNGLHEELAGVVESRDAEAASRELGDGDAASYRVERVLKESPAELTQLVWLRGQGGEELGPFVRKSIAAREGLGGVYRLLADAQREGRRFCHLPQVYSCSRRFDACGDERTIVVMEYVCGATLREVVERAAPGQRRALASVLMPAVCEAVAELHGAFSTLVVHRDLTPSNIMLPSERPASPVLIDFGIARSWREDAACDTAHFGTRAYAAPEQFGFGQTDARTDVYALGLLSFFCLAGRDPEPRDRERGFSDPDVPREWRSVIVRAAAFDPARRFSSALELEQAFCALGRHAPIDPRMSACEQPSCAPTQAPAPPPPAWRPSLRGLFSARNVVVAALAALSVLASYMCAFEELVSGAPSWYDLFGYAVYMPGNILAIALLLADKRRLAENVALFRGMGPARIRRLALIAMAALFVALLVLTLLVGR